MLTWWNEAAKCSTRRCIEMRGRKHWHLHQMDVLGWIVAHLSAKLSQSHLSQCFIYQLSINLLSSLWRSIILHDWLIDCLTLLVFYSATGLLTVFSLPCSHCSPASWGCFLLSGIQETRDQVKKTNSHRMFRLCPSRPRKEARAGWLTK